MTEIGFYHLLTTSLEKALPQIVQKSYDRGWRALIIAADNEHIGEVDKLLWTFDPDSFLPHGIVGEDKEELQPILIAAEYLPKNNPDVIISLQDIVIEDAAKYQRIIDIFDGRSELAVKQARIRWKKYQEMNLEMKYHKQNENGGWS
jgi:DNA polymerase-3 subunit chi